MSSYRQLSIEERCEIARLHEGGQSIRQIAAAVDRQPSTVSRELKRNKGSKIGYSPTYAQQQAKARRWSGSRLERDEDVDLEVTPRDRRATLFVPLGIAVALAVTMISYAGMHRLIP